MLLFKILVKVNVKFDRNQDIQEDVRFLPSSVFCTLLGFHFDAFAKIFSSVMVSMPVMSAVDHEFKSRLGQTKEYIICICFFCAKHSILRRKSKEWLAEEQDNVSK
jgi:activator of 2-hydroxyglutaryl-CoA dehydratase